MSSLSSLHPVVEVQTICLGLESNEVEALVTVPLEQTLQRHTWAGHHAPKSVSQLSAIRMIFKSGTDLMRGPTVGSGKIATATLHCRPGRRHPLMLQPLSPPAAA